MTADLKRGEFAELLERETEPAIDEVDAATVEREPTTLTPDIGLTPSAWPAPPAAAAFQGPLGDLVRLVEPYTEADPAAVLVQAAVMSGSAIGRRPHVLADGSRHSANLYAVVVAPTSKGRKGTSFEHARSPIALTDNDWVARIKSGLSSGEGLIYAVRDQMSFMDDSGDTKIIDEGVIDKRLCVVETEFAMVLRHFARAGNVLSGQLRGFWDRGEASTLTKSPLTATGAHVSVIGHVTPEDLLRHLDSTEIANGLANRFLWTLARRSKVLPRGGTVPDKELRELAARFARAFDFARRCDLVERDDEAWAVWEHEYEFGRLAVERPGLIGALLDRDAAITLRLSLLYALLDCSHAIGVRHLEAALAVWDYGVRSVLHIFGDSTGDPDADAILRALRASGPLNRTAISALFGRHRTANRISAALQVLVDYRLARLETIETGGRPAEVWHAV